MGAIMENCMANGIGSLGLPIFNIGFGIPAVWLGWGGMLPRLIDAVVDPLLGWASDNTRTRWGRRRPWICAGGLLGALFFVLIWCASPAWSTQTVLAWFIGISIFYYIAYGMYAISYNALGMELSADYNERTRVQAWRFIFINVSAQGLSWAYKLSFMPVFQLGMPKGVAHPEIYGMRGVGLAYAAIMLATALAPVLFCKERAEVPSERDKAEKVPLKEAFLYTLSNRLFVMFMLILVMGILGAFTGPFTIYLNIYYVFGGNKQAAATLIGVGSTLGMIASFGTAPMISWLSSRLGKRKVLLVGQCVGVPGALLGWYLYNPAYPYAQLLMMVTGVLGLPALLVLYNSIVVDICDLDELRTGQRREGVYGAVTAFVMKVVFTVTTVMTGYALSWSGFAEHQALQSAHTLRVLRELVVLWPAAMAAITAALLWYFPLTKRRSLQIRRVLERRRGRLQQVEI